MITLAKEEEPGVFKVEFVPSSPFCPIAFRLASDIKNAALKVVGVKKARIYCRGHTMEQQINEQTNKGQFKSATRFLLHAFFSLSAKSSSVHILHLKGLTFGHLGKKRTF